MKKLMLSLVGALAVTSSAIADDDETEVYEFTKATASSKAPYVMPKNVTNEANKAIGRALQDGGIIKQSIDSVTRKISDIDLGTKRDKTDELVYSQTEKEWDFSELSKIDPTKIYSIRIEMESDGDTTTYTYWLDRSYAGGGGSLMELEKHPDDSSVSNDNLTRYVIKSVVSPVADQAFVKLVGTVIYKRAILTGDTLAHESEKADAEDTSVYAVIDDGKIVIGGAKGLPIRNLSWYYNRENVQNIKILDKDTGVVEATAENVSDWNGIEPSFVAHFNYGGDQVKIKICTTNINLIEENVLITTNNLICGTRVAKDSKRLGGKTAAEWEALISSSSDMSSKRSLNDEAVYTKDWNFSAFEAITSGTYKFVSLGDTEHTEIFRGSTDIGSAEKVTVGSDTAWKVISVTDDAYASLVNHVIYKNKFVAGSDTLAHNSDVQTALAGLINKADAAIYGSKSEVITVNGHDVVVSIENGYAAKYIPLGFDGADLNVKFYLTVDGSKIEIPFDSCNGEACDDENDIYNTFTMISFGGDNFPEELTNLGITSVKIEYVSGSSDYSSSRFKYTINGTKESSTSIDVKNPAQAADSRKFDGKTAMDWVNTFLPLYFYNKTDANAEFHNKYYVDSNVVTGQIDGVFSEATPNDRNVRIVLRGATLPITDILAWTNKTDCIELYVSNNFSVAYSNPEVYQISTSGTPGFNIRFSEFPNVGIHLEGNVAYIGNAIAPEYKFIGGVGKPYAPWHNPGLAPNTYRFAGRTYEEAAEDAASRLEERVGHFVNATNELTIGSGATNVNHMESVTLNGCKRWPSYTWGFANVNIGLDNVTGFGDDGVGGVKNSEGVLENGKAYYDVVIGTSSSAKYMHSYVFGSQAHALAYNSFIFGYGATATDPDSTIIGFGARPQPDKKFSTHAEMLTYLRSFANYTAATNALFADMMLAVTNSDEHTGPRASPVNLKGSYYIKSVLTSKGGNTSSWAELYQTTPHPDRDEYIRGRHNWTYGKTHGNGTVNLVAKGDGVHDYGIANVYINDKSLNEWIGVHTGEPTYKTPYNKGLGGTPVLCESDRTVEIGINARATETSSSCQAIAIGRDALSDGPANVAVGPNAFACGNQAIAMGWRANAVGDHSISIGIAKMSGQDFYKDGEVNPNSDLALANGTEAINVGYNGKAIGARTITIGAMTRADAPQAIQIGYGTNHVEDSFQVRDYLFARRGEFKVGDVTIVKNGELVGGTVEATETDLSEASTVDYMTVLKLKSGSNVTVLPKISVTEFEDLEIEPAVAGGKRNYTVTLPNEPNLQDGLPIQFKSELPEGTKLVFRNGTKVFNKLPVQIKSEQPYDKLVIYTIDVLDDGTDWTPVVNRNNITYSGGNFANIGTTALRGHNLHAATEFKIVYPISATANKTNDVLNLTSGNEFSLSHLYRNANMSGFTTNTTVHNNDGKSWFEVIYKTVNGTAVVERKEFDVIDGITEETEGLKRLVNKLVWHMPNSDVPGTGYFEVSVTNAANSSIIASTNEVSVTYTLATNAKNTIKLADMTFSGGANGGIYKTGTITGLKIGGTNTLDYVTIDDDRTNSVICVVSDPNL